ncbi:hypothetical protein COCSUDRAFT_258, partial [Coccomyxa subellipsoidea C-169]
DAAGGGRFLKTLLCLHDDGGLVVVKVYYKRDDVPDLRGYESRLLEIRERLSGPACVHVLPFQAFLESDRAAYLIRPYIFADLYHRLSTRPFLSSIEKRWIAFQLLHALAQVHERGVCHGDIKCENALVTSWNWVYLADFASYKPTYLPVDNPADFSFYFDTGGRRRCYIAPERFYESGTSDVGQLAVQRLMPEMDIFSMGCVIAELFMEGKALFDLSKLLSYRRGEYDPSNDLAQVEAPMQQLVMHMIQLEPGKRLSAAAYLEQWGPRLFPAYFEAVLHPFFTALLPMDADERVAAMLIVAAGYQGRESTANGMVLITVLLCTLVRGAKLQEAKTRAVALLSKAAALCDDDTRLQRVVPYLLSMMLKGEAPASVQCAALRSLSHVLSTIDTVPTSDAKIFNEYILPALSLIPAEAEESVRVEYAGILAQLAATAHRFLMRLQMPATSTQQQEQMGALRSAFTGVFQDLVVSPRSTPFTRRAILPHLPHLATVLGRKLSNDFLLPTMITFLNDRDWQTRAAFFRDVSCIASQAGFSGMEAFLLPCVEQARPSDSSLSLLALADESEAVIAEAIGFLTRVVEGRHMRKRSLLAATARVAAKLQHTASTAMRAAASDFIAAAARSLSPAETYALLTPLVMPAMATEPVIMTDPRSVAACFRPGDSSQTTLDGIGNACLFTLLNRTPRGRLGRRRPSPTTCSRRRAAGRSCQAPQQAHRGNGALTTFTLLDQLPSCCYNATFSSCSRRKWCERGLRGRSTVQASVSGRLAAGVRSIHLSSEGPLSFQPGGASRGISDAIDAAIHTDLPAHPYAGTTPWQPRGVLVAHLAEHKRAVNRIAVAPNGAFFVTASNDETCKIWDSRRLEKDISFRSKLTYASQACSQQAFESKNDVASASSNGSVHVWRVEYTSRSGGAPDRYNGIIGTPAPLSHLQHSPTSTHFQNCSGIHAWDLRADTLAWTLPCTSNQARPRLIPLRGCAWLLTGSSRGYLTLWDMRFQLAVNSIQQPQGFPIDALAPALAPPTKLGLQESSLATPLVYVAAGPQEIGLYDVEQGKCHQVLRVIGKDEPDSVRSELPYAIRRAQKPLPPAMDAAGLARHLSVAELQAPPQRPAGCRALLPTGAGPLLSGGSDGCVRFWDAARPDASFMVSGP